MKILYNFASRSRPHKLIACLGNIFSLARHNIFEIVVTLDEDDVTVNNEAIKNMVEGFGEKVNPIFGVSKNKVDAINKNVTASKDWDILCNHSDDMWFIKEGFDLDIIEAFKGYSGLVHFPDQKAKKALITYAMMSRDYYERFGYIYHPDFVSVYCDHEQQDVAKRLNKYKFVNKNILEHRHAIWGYGERDELLNKTQNPIIYAKDKQTYQRRMKINFGL